ncbi:MAG: hypothetical protein ACOYN0_19570 [Phycisphaerales bacterium]
MRSWSFKIGLAVGLWLIVLAGAMGATHAYMGRAGPSGGPVLDWPAACGLSLATDRPTAVVFVHPRCPCTSATIKNLALGMTDSSSGMLRPLSVIVVLSGPAATGDDGGFLERFSRLGSPSVVNDPAGAIAARFGAATSGHVVLCGADGKVRFSGGVTSGRGHEGWCGALDSLGRVLGDAAGARVGDRPETTPVYGCPLFDGGACTAPASRAMTTNPDSSAAACCGTESKLP